MKVEEWVTFLSMSRESNASTVPIDIRQTFLIYPILLILKVWVSRDSHYDDGRNIGTRKPSD